MDPQDHLDARLDGLTCAVCEAAVPSGSRRLLAHREDLAFVQVDCPECGSTTLAFGLGDADGGARTAVAGRSGAAAVTAADVLAMREFLAGWSGGLRELLAGGPSPDAETP